MWLTKTVDRLVTTPATRTFGLWLLDRIGRIVSGIPAKNIDHMVAVLQNATGIEFDMVCGVYIYIYIYTYCKTRNVLVSKFCIFQGQFILLPFYIKLKNFSINIECKSGDL